MKKINIGIFAHVDAGKTTTVTFTWNDCKVNLLDTPGHMDFISEVERSMLALDGAILAISAKEGIQSQTRVLYQTLKKLKIPTVLYINKVDRLGVNLQEVYESIEQYLSPHALVLEQVSGSGSKHIQIHNSLESKKEHICEFLSLLDDDFMIDYLNQESMTIEAMKMTMKKLFSEHKILPVLHGSALHGVGIDSLLDLITDWLNPIQDIDLSARVYKVDRDSKGQRRCFLRIFGGTIKLRSTYEVNDGEREVKIRKIAALKGVKTVPIEYATAGDIIIVYTHDLKIEDIIGLPPPLSMKSHIADPTLKADILYKHIGERKLILHALEELTDEDPFLDFSIHPFTEAIEVKLFGVVQREILQSMLKERFDMDTYIENPATLYKERPTNSSSFTQCMYRDTLLPASIGLKIEPLALGSGFVYESKVSLGDLKKTFQNGVYEGVKKGIELGPKGWPLTDLKVTFIFSEYDSVNSTPSDYRNLAPEVIQSALDLCGTQLLEPLLKFQLQVPIYAAGRAITDVLRMKGEMREPMIIGEEALLEGILPVETCKAYHGELADYTEGKGLFQTTFHGYRTLE